MWRSRTCAAVLVLAGLAAAPGASAADRPGCAPPVEISAIRVIRVEKNGVLVLHDGRAAKVEGILLPRGRHDHAPSFFAHQAIAALAERTRGHEVTLTARPPKEDRYGRLRAQVFVRQTNGEPWLQAAMLRRGLARVNIAPDRRECADELYAAERKARAAHAGIWASAAYAIRTPEALAGDRGTFQIVEGVVKSADVRGGRAYLNFGADWRTDFTATISPADMKRFRASGIDPRRLAGMRVRVRGWIQSLNGPEIEIAEPEQIEVLGPAVAPSPTSGVVQEKRPR